MLYTCKSDCYAVTRAGVVRMYDIKVRWLVTQWGWKVKGAESVSVKLPRAIAPVGPTEQMEEKKPFARAHADLDTTRRIVFIVAVQYEPINDRHTL